MVIEMNKLEQLINEFCPEGVEYKALGELGEFYSGLNGKSKDDFNNGNAKFITYMNVFSNPSLKIDIDDKTVTITIPPAKVLGCKVDEKTLTKDSFIVANNSAKVEAEHQTEAFKEAQAKMQEEASKDTVLLANAQQRAQKLLEDYVNNIGDCVGKNYSIKWVYLDGAKELNNVETEETAANTEA